MWTIWRLSHPLWPFAKTVHLSYLTDMSWLHMVKKYMDGNPYWANVTKLFALGRVEKKGSTGSMLPEHPRFCPGTHKAREYLKAVWSMDLYCFRHIFCVNNSIYPLFLSNSCSIVLWYPKFKKLSSYSSANDWCFVIKVSGTGASPIFAPGAPQDFFQLCLMLCVLGLVNPTQNQ